MLTLQDVFEMQAKFSGRFHDLDALTVQQREELTKTLALGLMGEASALANCINFREHRRQRVEVSRDRMCHEAVDVIRYAVGILNAWNVSPDAFADAYVARDDFLRMRDDMHSRKYDGRPTLIVDVDDVVASFRMPFAAWLRARGVDVDPGSSEYYFVPSAASTNGKRDFNSEELYQEFISGHGLRDLVTPIEAAVEAVNGLRESGMWVQLLTSRPSWNLTCVYDTHQWLARSGLQFDRIDFAGEKMLWLMGSEPYRSDAVVCAIEDSSKHAAEYVRHGVKVVAPVMSYNSDLTGLRGVSMYDCPTKIDEIVDSIRRGVSADHKP